MLEAEREREQVVYLEIDIEACKGCGLCVSVCPGHLLSLDLEKRNKKGYAPCRISCQADCLACCNCAVMCPDNAITIVKKVRYAGKTAVERE